MPNRGIRIAERMTAALPRIEALRTQCGDRPILLTRSGSVNWATGGLSDPVDVTASSDPVWVVQTSAGRALIANEIEIPRLESDFDVAAMGWQLIGVPWYDADAPLSAALDFCGGSIESMLTDRSDFGLDATDAIIAARMTLSAPEQHDLRSLGALTAQALSAGIDAWKPGAVTDHDVAATISYHLERHGAKAVCLIVGGDQRLRTLRHPLAVGETVHDALMVVVVARRGGLHVAATRIAVRDPHDPILGLVDQLIPVATGVLAASRPGETWGLATETLARGYESIGHPGVWREHFQGGPIAFEQREFELAPHMEHSPFWNLQSSGGVAVAWNPSLRGGAKIEDTYLMGPNGAELVTTDGLWPLTSWHDGAAFSSVRVVE